MRELIRFGEDFHETCSIRSKLVKTKQISKQLDDLLVTNTSILDHERQVLNLFQSKMDWLKEKRETTQQKIEKTQTIVFKSQTSVENKNLLITQAHKSIF